MATDWKDLLSSLKDDMPAPEEETCASAAEPSAPADAPPADRLHITVERKGRKGKTATIIDGFTCDDDTLQQTARTLKQRIGTGGSARGGEILLQGEWRERAAAELRSLGYRI